MSNTAERPPDAAPSATAPGEGRSWSERLRSPTGRELIVGFAGAVIFALVSFGARELWGALHRPAAAGQLTYEGTSDAYLSRADFYERYVHEPTALRASQYGGVFLVQTKVEHASRCSFVWTVRNAREQEPIGSVDQAAPDVAGGTGCNGERRVWLPWPCAPSGTPVQFEIVLVAGSKQLDSIETETFPTGGGCA